MGGALKHVVVTLDGVEVVASTHGLNSAFPENSTFTLGLRNIKEPTSEDVVALEDNMRTLTPAKLGLILHGSCPMPIFQAVLRGAAANSSLFMLTLEDLDAAKTELVAALLNRNPSIRSLGFPRGSFNKTVAQVLADKVQPGNTLRALVLSRVEDSAVLTGGLFRKILVERFASLQTLDVSRTDFDHPGLAHVCDAVSLHRTLRALKIQDCKVSGGKTATLTSSLTNLLRHDQTLETIKLNGTNLWYCDISPWESLCCNTTLRKLSLQGCFQSPQVWMEVYEGLERGGCRRPVMSWNMATDGLTMAFGSHGGVVECAKHEQSFDFDWMIRLIEELPEARHTIVVTPKSLHNPAIVDGLASLVALQYVQAVAIQVPTHSDVIKLITGTGAEGLQVLERVLPKAHAGLKQIDFAWEAYEAPSSGISRITASKVEEKKTP